MEKKHTILCIDDEESILQALFRTLRSEPYDILLANSGEEGLEKLKSTKIDLIICDQKMPNMSGFEVLRAAKQEYPNTTRIMLSGYSDFESLVKTINEGEIFRYIQKPWDTDTLKETIKLALNQQEEVSDLNNILAKVTGLENIVQNISVDQSQDLSSIFINIVLFGKKIDSKNISLVINHILRMINKDNEANLDPNNGSISINENTVQLELILKTGVKLAICLKASEN